MAVARGNTRERQLGDILIEQGVVTPLQLDEAIQRQRLTGDMLGRVLVSMGHCKEQNIIEALGIQSGMERVEVAKLQIPAEVLSKITPDVAKFYTIVPVRIVDGALIVAMADPLNVHTLDDLSQITGMEVRGAVSNQEDIGAAHKANYATEASSMTEMLGSLEELVGTAELTLDELGQCG
jgi:type IV pilus assembly protein PilB